MKGLSKGFLVMAVALLAGCEDNTGPELSPEGTWALFTVNGQTLPYRISWGTQSQTWITAGTRVIRADGTCTNVSTTETYTVSPFGGTTMQTNTNESVCTWSRRSGNRFTITTDGFTFQARLDGGDLVVTAPSGTEFLYQ